MDKYAELNKRITMYNACRGILRIKLAAGEAQPQQNQAYGAGNVLSRAGSTAYEAITGSTDDNNIGSRIGSTVANIGGKAYNGVTGAMAKSKNKIISGIGNFLNKNQQALSNIIGGADKQFGWSDQLNAAVKGRNYANQAQQVQAAQQQAAQQQDAAQFDPDSMFASMFQNMAGAANNMYRPQQYYGSTYRPSFA